MRLLTCIKNENRKIRRSVIWLACLLLPVLSIVMGTGNYLMNQEILQSEWYSLWTQVSLFYSTFFYAPLVGLCAAYLWRLEYFGHNWNCLMTMPVPVRDLFLGKMFVLCKLTIFTQVWMMALYYLAGRYAHLSGAIPGEILWWALRGTLAAFAVGALQLFLSLLIRNFAIPIGIALLGGVFGLLVPNADPRLGLVWPYSLMLMGMNSNKSEDVMSGITGGFFLFSVLFFFLFSLLGILILKKREG